MKMWSLGTALRNPRRIQSFLVVLEGFIQSNNGRWNEIDELDYYIELIKARVVQPKNVSIENLSQSHEIARRIMLLKYEDAPIRGRVLGSLFNKLGLVEIGDRIELTNLGNRFIENSNEQDFQCCLIEALRNWRINNGTSQLNPLCRGHIQSYDFNPFLATVNLIREVNRLEGRDTGISFFEYIYFVKVLDSNQLILSSANLIVQARRNTNLMQERIVYVRTNCSNKYNDTDYADNEIKYFVNTGLISFDRTKGIISLT